MSFDFPKPSLPAVSKSTPEKLVKLANQQPDQKIPLPTVDRVLEAIKQNRDNQVTELEWIYCIHAKEEWDKKNPHCSLETSVSIWKVATNHEWLRHQLLWYFALYCGGEKDKLANSLANSFNVLADSPLISLILPVKIMRAVISDNSGLKLAEICCEENLNQKEFSNSIKNDLPNWIPQFNQFTEYITQHFCEITSPNQQQVNWLLRCLNEMSREIQINAVNHLLINFPKEFASNYPQLVEWLRDHYLNNDKWNQLSDEAQNKLREWIGAVNYADFQNLVNFILNIIGLKDWEKNQLRRRRDFWADYTNGFQQLRILLPQSSLNAITNKDRTNIDLLEDDGSDTTEVCIFKFDEWIVVEFFRGRGSEMRLFPNNIRNNQMLFYKSGLSVKRIRALGGYRHDHKYLWQVECRKWLQKKGIHPNPGSLPGGQPTPDKYRQRQNKLEQWNDEIRNLEREARDYCE
ncbi:MAG: hypothetical protein KI793_08545 [Rivularia sp. (in: Bacteria)]|nr:hypothetical protein [Rivularia sp. MS3]